MKRTKREKKLSDRISLMSLLVSLCQKNYPDSMNLKDDFKSVQNASKSL